MPSSTTPILPPACRVLVTGASGFVGFALLERLSCEAAFDPVAAIRRTAVVLPDGVKSTQVPALEEGGSWTHALQGIDVVVHTAARVHVMEETATDPLTEFRKVNVAGTLNLARQAVDAGVKRFVFISTVKVNGEFTDPGHAFAEQDSPAPLDAYGISKHEAEHGLRELATQTGMELVIIRPPLVYGPNVKANFQSMMRWLDKGIPLPLGAIHNKRTLVGLHNLVDLIVTCISHQAATNQIFLAGDGNDLSTTELLRKTSAALGKPARLLPVPMWLINAAAGILGKNNIAQRLCGNLQVDISKARSLLGWQPPFSVDEELRLTADAYRKSRTL